MLSAPGDIPLALNSNQIALSSGVKAQPISNSSGEIVCYEVLSYFSDSSGNPLHPPSILSSMSRREKNRHTLILAKLATQKIETAISLNLFGCQLEDLCFVEELCQTLRIGDVIELVEQSPIFIDKSTTKALEALEASGIQVALDDFGSGHFNFDLLALEQVNYLKLDMLFFRKIYASEQAILTLQGLVKSLRCYDVKVVVEGIESQAELESCLLAGADLFQGYHLGKPFLIT
ncbi:EAL domain-containing protein [Vibrio sp. CUB2]|uniref:EAL domain-containing protein n=1 Tax=Vibrio sp. CUB2 TaxID=2315233 RepID=UPI00076A4220|nr:EAL domain-containing protein [Vibrio sp. CUB2]